MKVYLLLCMMGWATFAQSQQLKRQAVIDFSIMNDQKTMNPIVINKVPESSFFYTAGLRKDDRLISINDVAITNAISYNKQVQKLKGGEKIKLVITRAAKTETIYCVPQARPLEELSNCTVTYGEVKTPKGHSVRTIISRPKGVTGKLPVLFFIQWLSPDQVEINRQNMDGWAYLIEDLAQKTGYILIRTEKPGLGDSEGPHCGERDLWDDINAYKASFKQMLNYDFVDKDNIIVVGGSIGGALAPIVAEGQKLKGIISTGGFSTTWYEHILDFERSRLFYAGTPAKEIDSLVKDFSTFYYEYLILKKKPSQIISRYPKYKNLWYQSDDLQFGRPALYYQQLQDLNMSYYWQKIKCPVLVLYGEYDWIMSRAEQENIFQVLNAQKKGQCELQIIPGMNHHFSRYNSPKEAFEEPSINYEPTAFEAMNKWIKKLVGL